jgi:septal ring factor EnvC (AmiA/AmiB activator)
MRGPMRLAVCLQLLAAPALAQPDDAARRLREAEAAVARERAAQSAAQREARASVETLRRLEAERTAAITRWRRAEADAGGIAEELREAEAAREAAEAQLAGRALLLSPLLPVIQRLALFPQETLLAEPGSVPERLAALAVLRAAAASLGAEARATEAALAAAIAAREKVRQQNQALLASLAELRGRATALDEAVAAARAARGETEAAEAAQARRLAVAAATAADLRGLVSRLETPSREPLPPAAPAAAAAATPPPGRGIGPGRLAWPVRGRLIGRHGEPDDGLEREGVGIAATPGARVLAPCTGRIAYAAPFRTLGPLLILDCGDLYHVVLAGLQRLDAVVGQAVSTGDPVGAMPSYDPRAGRRAILSMEVRRAGRALDPEVFLSRQQDRIGG